MKVLAVIFCALIFISAFFLTAYNPELTGHLFELKLDNIFFSLLGLAVILLDVFGLITLPLSGSSRVLTFIVLGVLFAVFLLTGFISLGNVKKLKPEVEKEEKLINDIVEFIKQNKLNGSYKKPNPENYEAEYLELNNKVVSDVKEAFPDLEPGFAYYVVDRFAGDILDED